VAVQQDLVEVVLEVQVVQVQEVMEQIILEVVLVAEAKEEMVAVVVQV
tara:strand:- start:65 stop:208 length:144 start_codon:yes stop_codon:yes gene_type:complete